jgi:pimeloyl-ACP methyl ester carboxylesterase
MLPKIKNYTIQGYFNWFKLQRIPAHKLSYAEWGDPNNENIVLCVHGLTRNARDFDKLADRLCKNFRVICIDVVGRGQSEWFENKYHYNYDTYVKDILSFIEGVRLKNLHYVGTSMGGIIGFVIAARHPELFKSIVLNDIGPFIQGSSLARIAKYVGLQPIFDNFELAKAHFKVILSPFGIKDDEDWTSITKHGTFLSPDGKYKLAYDPEIVMGMNITPQNIKDVNLWAIWNKVENPTLVIRGEKSDILSIETAEEMLKTKKSIKLYTVPEVGHAPALMDKAQIDVIEQWLLDNKK